MAAPLIGMDRSEFERIQDKAKQQLDDQKDTTACDIGTMALQIAWLDRRYHEKSVYFALLNVPGMDIATFHPTTLITGSSSTGTRTAYSRWPTSPATRLKMRSSCSTGSAIWPLLAPPGHDEEWCIRDDEERNARIDRLTAAVETWLNGMRRCINIPFWDSAKFSDRDGTLLGTLCLAWAETVLRLATYIIAADDLLRWWATNLSQPPSRSCEAKSITRISLPRLWTWAGSHWSCTLVLTNRRKQLGLIQN
ncbi:hypothetical protein VTK56DRAFT_5928 [Thermocarpiscus australiensis]